mgnify:CR=1 FL=1
MYIHAIEQIVYVVNGIYRGETERPTVVADSTQDQPKAP